VNYASPSISIAKTAAAQETLLLGFNGANKRWALSLGDTAAELGSDAGSNFAIYRYNDAGSIRDAPLTINRAAATAVFANNVTLSAGYFAAPGGFAVSGAGGGCTLSGDATNSYWFVNQPNNCYIQYAKASGQLTFIVNSAAVFYWDVNKNFITTAGGYKPGGGTWADSSDARIKNVEGDFTTGLDAVAALRPVTFTFKGNDTPDAPAHFTTSFDTETKDAPTVPYPNSPHRQAAVDGKRFHGLIAQDVESVFPEMVTQRAGYIDGVAVNDIRDLDTGPLIFALVNSVKELKTHIDTLNTRLATLEAA
jgi:hypothetical protein